MPVIGLRRRRLHDLLRLLLLNINRRCCGYSHRRISVTITAIASVAPIAAIITQTITQPQPQSESAEAVAISRIEAPIVAWIEAPIVTTAPTPTSMMTPATAMAPPASMAAMAAMAATAHPCRTRGHRPQHEEDKTYQLNSFHLAPVPHQHEPSGNPASRPVFSLCLLPFAIPFEYLN